MRSQAAFVTAVVIGGVLSAPLPRHDSSTQLVPRREILVQRDPTPKDRDRAMIVGHGEVISPNKIEKKPNVVNIDARASAAKGNGAQPCPMHDHGGLPARLPSQEALAYSSTLDFNQQTTLWDPSFRRVGVSPTVEETYSNTQVGSSIIDLVKSLHIPPIPDMFGYDFGGFFSGVSSMFGGSTKPDIVEVSIGSDGINDVMEIVTEHSIGTIEVVDTRDGSIVDIVDIKDVEVTDYLLSV